MLLNLFVRPERAGDLERPEYLEIFPQIPVNTFIDNYGNRCARIVAPAGQLTLRYDNVCCDNGRLDEQGFGAYQHTIDELPLDVLPFLLASRYCEVDRVTQLAWDM